MSSLGEPATSSGEPLVFGVYVFGPISSVPGSATISYFQPLLTGKVFASAGLLIGAELFLFLAQRLFKLEGVPIICPREDSDGSILRIPVPELQELLGMLAKYQHAGQSGKNLSSSNISSNIPEQASSLGGSLTTETAEIPFVVALAVIGDYSTIPFSSSVYLSLPIFTIPGIRGALPVLILSILGTIFVRAVVPPETTGSKPLKRSSSVTKPFQINSEDIIKLLNRFGKYFNSQ